MNARVLMILVSVFVSGCPAIPKPGEASGHDQTRAFAGECIFQRLKAQESGAISGVMDAVVGGFISGTLGRIGTALRAAGEEDADVVVGRYPGEFEPGNPLQCIFIAKGRWSSADEEEHKITDSEGQSQDIKFDDYYLLVDPNFFLEIAVQRSSGGNALRLVPNYFEYQRLIETSSESDDENNRGIALEVAVHAPGVGPTDPNAVGATLVLGTMTTGYAYNLRSGERRKLGCQCWEEDTNYLPLEYTSAWFPTFAPEAQNATNSESAAANSSVANQNTSSQDETDGTNNANEEQAVATDGANSQEGEAARPASEGPSPTPGANDTQANDERKRQFLPRTVTVTFTETRAPRKFLLFLADVFDASKEEIQKAAELAVLESKKAEAQLAAAQASTALMTDYLTKLSAAEVKVIEYCGASTDDPPAGNADRISKSSAANVAQRVANVAALAASQPQPFTSFVPVSGGPVDSNFCSL